MKRALALLLFIIVISGCAYYNTFFNAKNFFKEAQELELRENGKPVSNAVQKYNKVIKKCGVIITDFPNSDYVDDAVMLMGRAFFYKGTNYNQAADKFNEIIKFYPESEFVPDAHIYLAMVDYKMRKPEIAYEKLKAFIIDPEFKDSHAKALNIIANYYLEEDNLAEADFYFKQIIIKYPESDHFESAFFARGKTFHLAKKYQQSNEVFLELIKSRINKKLKLDARYYITLNHLLMGDAQKAEKNSKSLLKQEYRIEKTPKIRLLLARAKAENDEINDAIEICESIMDNNKRSLLSAETSYYLAEIYFDKEKNYEKAIEFYNKVKSEKSTSPFVQEALAKSVVAAQIIQYYQPNSELSQTDLVDQQFMLAEHYVHTLDMPDSALVVYANIINDINHFEVQMDSLETNKILLHEALLDSLENLEIVKLDTLSIPVIADSLIVETDSLKTITTADSVIVKIATVDSTNYMNVKAQIEQTKNIIKTYQTDFIPYTRFLRLWIFKNIIIDSTNAKFEYEQLQDLGNNNKYAFAAKKLWDGEEVEFTTFREQMELSTYEEAISYLEDDPLTSLELLSNISLDSTHYFYDKAVFSSAYINYMVFNDSISAQPFVDLILSNDKSEFNDQIKVFYEGGKFKYYDRLPYLELLEKKTAEAEAAAVKAAEEAATLNKPAKVEGDQEIEWPTIRDELDTGIIILELEIDAEGKLGEIAVLQSLKEDKKSLDKIVIAQVKNWKFTPAFKDGEAIDSILELSFTYEQKK